MTIIAEGMYYRILSDGTWFYPQYWSNRLCWEYYRDKGSIACSQSVDEVFKYLTPNPYHC